MCPILPKPGFIFGGFCFSSFSFWAIFVHSLCFFFFGRETVIWIKMNRPAVESGGHRSPNTASQHFHLTVLVAPQSEHPVAAVYGCAFELNANNVRAPPTLPTPPRALIAHRHHRTVVCDAAAGTTRRQAVVLKMEWLVVCASDKFVCYGCVIHPSPAPPCHLPAPPRP